LNEVVWRRDNTCIQYAQASDIAGRERTVPAARNSPKLRCPIARKPGVIKYLTVPMGSVTKAHYISGRHSTTNATLLDTANTVGFG
jgi:hypothetical protein